MPSALVLGARRRSAGSPARAPGAARRRSQRAFVDVALLRVLLALVLAVIAIPASAHKASDAYLQLDAGASGLDLRLDVALRDLDAAIELDADDDGRLTWGEVKAAWPRLEAYALARVHVDGCELKPTGRALERRNDGAYAVLRLHSDCRLAGPPRIAYTLLREVDPTHRGIVRLQRAGEPLALAVLDPAQPAVVIAGGASAAVAGASAPGADASGWTANFLREGVHHIVTGYDHVLFLLCLLLPSVMRRTRDGWQPVDNLRQAVLPVVGIVSAFTVAHSITLGIAALKLVSLPPSFIEPAIAVTIILAALDNVRPIFPLPRVAVTFFFGLIHGFGFAGVLAELELPTRQFMWALLQFNLGLELGQLMIVLGVTALLYTARGSRGYATWAIRGGSMAAMALGALWLVERTASVSLLPF